VYKGISLFVFNLHKTVALTTKVGQEKEEAKFVIRQEPIREKIAVYCIKQNTPIQYVHKRRILNPNPGDRV
jgi:hypothetical protein